MDHRNSAFAARTTIAALAALLVAQAMRLEHAHWAAMTVFLLVQPTRELTLERSFARLGGTALGACAGWLILLTQPANPLILGVQLAVWVGFCAGVACLFRHFHAYGILLAGYTAAIVALAAFTEPQHREALALGRVGCTFIGVIAAGFAGAWLPRQDRGELQRRLRQIVARVLSAASEIRQDGEAGRNCAEALVHAIGDVQAQIDDLAAGSWRNHVRAHCGRDLLARLGVLIAELRTVASAGDDPALLRQIAVLSGWGEALSRGEATKDLLASLEISQNQTPVFPAAGACLRALAMIEDLPPVRRRCLPTPHGLDRRGTIAAFARPAATAIVASSIWYISGWKEGMSLVMAGLIFTTLFSSHRDPTSAVNQVLKGSLAGALAGLVWQNFLLRHADNALELAVMVAPVLAAFAFAMTRPGTDKAAIDANMTFLLTAQPVLPLTLDGWDTVQHAAAIIGGVLLAVAAFRCIFPTNPAAEASHIVSLMRRDYEIAASIPTLDVVVLRRARIAQRLVDVAALGTPAQVEVQRGLELLVAADGLTLRLDSGHRTSPPGGKALRRLANAHSVRLIGNPPRSPKAK